MEASKSQYSINRAHAELTAFFSAYPAQEAEMMLWNWLKMTIKGDYDQLGALREQSFASFFDALNGLLKASHVLLHTSEKARCDA